MLDAPANRVLVIEDKDPQSTRRDCWAKQLSFLSLETAPSFYLRLSVLCGRYDKPTTTSPS